MHDELIERSNRDAVGGTLGVNSYVHIAMHRPQNGNGDIQIPDPHERGSTESGRSGISRIAFGTSGLLSPTVRKDCNSSAFVEAATQSPFLKGKPIPL